MTQISFPLRLDAETQICVQEHVYEHQNLVLDVKLVTPPNHVIEAVYQCSLKRGGFRYDNRSQSMAIVPKVKLHRNTSGDTVWWKIRGAEHEDGGFIYGTHMLHFSSGHMALYR